MKTNNSQTSSKILIVGAMESELRYLLKEFSNIKKSKLINQYTLYDTIYHNIEVSVVETYVGEVNASIAGYEAIRSINPDFVIKFGTVGGSYKESKSGDIIIPLGFFHRTSWITRDKTTNLPTSNSSSWQSVFGELPYQVNNHNLGNMPYFFPVNRSLIQICQKSLNRLKMKHTKAYLGGGNMWMFDKKLLDNVAETMLPRNFTRKKFVSDMESYSLAHACYVMHKPFIGCYVVASNDYLDESYNPILVPTQMKRLVPYVLDLCHILSDKNIYKRNLYYRNFN